MAIDKATPTQISIIYVDVDGVLADFEGYADTLMNGTLRTNPKRAMWDQITKHIAGGGRFWYEMPTLDDADELMEAIVATGKRVEFLTACGDESTSAQDKRDWLFERYPDHVIHLVRSSVDKALYAEPDAILIDDRLKSINPWNKAGGVGILHTNAKDTISQLNSILG